MRVVGVVGLPGSGKSEAATAARDCGVPVVAMGDAIRAACRERGLDPDVHHGDVARALREEECPAAVAERTLGPIRNALDDADTVLVDGIRSDAEVDRFAETFGDAFRLVEIDALDAVRADRIESRGRDDTDAESLRERDERERGFGMDAAMARADLTIRNAGTLDAFHDRVRTLLTDGPGALADDDAVTVHGAGGAP
jgi:dephospho-CoA kinase